jgi:hypothetical protein
MLTFALVFIALVLGRIIWWVAGKIDEKENR